MSDDTALAEAIQDGAEEQGNMRLLSISSVQELARAGGISERDVEIAALRRQIMPARYQRNFGTIGWEGQIKLLESTAAVIGAGGLGGYIVEALARMGIGHITIVDGDVFEAHNLNRQILCTEELIGAGKAACAAARVQIVNSAVQARVVTAWADAENLPEILLGANVVMDALDSLPVRFVLQDAAATLGIPMVHGAIAGYVAQVMTIMPGDRGLKDIYGEGELPQKGVEVFLGNPAATPMLCAACQVQEVIKLLTGTGELLRNRLLMIDAECWDVQIIDCGPSRYS
jgi:molybdopterin-synthase adenylyltransferase